MANKLDIAGSCLLRYLEPVVRAFNTVGTAIVLVMSLLVGSTIILRLFFNTRILGTVELEGLMLAILVFFGVGHAMVREEHIRVDILISRFAPPARAVFNSITSFLSLGLCWLLVWQIFVFAQVNWKLGISTDMLQLPLFPFILAAVAGSLLLFAALLGEFLTSLGQLPKRGGWLVLGGLTGLLLSGVLVYLLQLSSVTMAIIGFALLLLALLSGIYVAFAMMLVGFLGMTYISGINAGFNMMGVVPYETVSTYTFCVIPFFVLMGNVCGVAGISQDLYYTMYNWLGRLKGGLAMATVGACSLFAAVSGSSVGTAAVMGKVALPEMERYRYSPQLAAGCVAAGGTLGILIPPSMNFIIYGLITDQSIGRLFVAGIFPGLLLASLFMLTIYIQVRLNPQIAPLAPRTSLKDKVISLKGTWAVFALFALVIGGLYLGIFTPTEAGAAGACGALIIALSTRRLSWRGLISALRDTGRVSTVILIMMFGAAILGYFLSGSKAPHLVSTFISELGLNRYVVLVAVLLVYAFLGCFMNNIPAIIVTLPILFPSIVVSGFDPIWFGVLLVIMMEMGLITPPVGMNVFVIKGVAPEIPLSTIFRGIFPFIAPMVICIVILTLFPQIALFLPNLMFGG